MFVADDLQQVAIRVEKIQAVMISPVNRPLGRYTTVGPAAQTG